MARAREVVEKSGQASACAKSVVARNTTTMKSLDKRASQLRKHRVNMVEFRLKKKQQYNSLQTEHRQLERVMKNYVRVMQDEVPHCYASGVSTYQPVRMLHELIVEKEALWRQNMALFKEIESYSTIHKTMLSPIQTALENDSPVLPVSGEGNGWWVHFDNGVPSFYFHPFSPKQVEATANPFDSGFATNLPASSSVGNFLGWSVCRELSPPDNSEAKMFSSRVQFTKRVRCSIDTAFKVASVREKDLRPVLAMPVGWTCNRRHELSTQVLQDTSPECRVMVHNIPGPTNIHYVFLARVAQWKLQDGRRKMAFSMMITDSKANRLSRDADAQQQYVEWVTEGWAYFTITEVDDNTTDVVYEHCAGCESKSDAGFLMAQWAQFIVRWEQVVVPSNLLSFLLLLRELMVGGDCKRQRAVLRRSQVLLDVRYQHY